MVAADLHNRSTPGFFRRLFSGLYDWLLIIALMMVFSVPAVALRDGEPIDPGNPVYRFALVVGITAYFIVFWCWGGQTPGMKAWRLRAVTGDGGAVSPRQATIRFAAACVSVACAGLGLLQVFWNKDQLSWPDLWSDTRLELLQKRNKSG